MEVKIEGEIVQARKFDPSHRVAPTLYLQITGQSFVSGLNRAEVQELTVMKYGCFVHTLGCCALEWSMIGLKINQRKCLRVLRFLLYSKTSLQHDRQILLIEILILVSINKISYLHSPHY